MQLALDHVGRKVGADRWLYELRLAPCSGEVTVLLGATQAGKTSLMRIRAGLDVPGNGRVRVNGHGVTGMPVRQSQVPLL